MNWAKLFPGRRARASAARPTRYSSPLRVEQLEDRSVPAASAFPFTGNSFGGGSFNPFPGFVGQVNYASGDVNGDGVADLIAAEGAGPGSGSEIRIFDGATLRNGQVNLIADFYAYSNAPGASQTPGFAGGVNVAAGDLNGDGSAELITGTGPGGDGHVKVFNFRDPATGQFLGSNPTLQASFIAYPGFDGNVSVAVLRQGGTQPPLVVTASGAGTTATDVRLYSGLYTLGSVSEGTLVQPASRMIAFPGYLGGVSIATGNTVAGGPDQLFISPNTGASLISSFNLSNTGGAYALNTGTTFQTGFTSPNDVRLGTADLAGNGVDNILTASVGPTGAGSISVYALGTGGATLLNPLSGFQGFGYFGNNWLSSSLFAPAVTAGYGTGTTTGALAPIGASGGMSTGIGSALGTSTMTTGLSTFGFPPNSLTGLGGVGTGIVGSGVSPLIGTGSASFPTQSLVTSTPEVPSSAPQQQTNLLNSTSTTNGLSPLTGTIF